MSTSLSGPTKLYASPLVRTNNSARARVATWIKLREEGHTNVEIAEKMGISRSTLHTIIQRANKEGWLVFDDIEDRIEHEIAPMVVDVVKHHLERKSEKMAIEAAKGLGYFKSHQAVKIDGDVQQTNLQLNIELTGELSKTPGNIVGTPKLPIIDIKPIDPD